MADIDLTPFCGGQPFYSWLLKPFSFGDFTLATNGHIMVRVPRRADCPDIERPGKWLSPLDGIDRYPFQPLRLRLPPPPTTSGICPDCDGLGELDCETDCARCDGHGDLDVETRTSTCVADHYFSLHYIRLMASLPSIEIAASSVSIQPPMRPLFFRFAGGDGALMPMTRGYPRHVRLAPQ